MTNNLVSLKVPKEEVRRLLRRDLLSPSFLLVVLITLGGPWLIPALSYFFLWTYRAFPSGIVSGVAIGGLLCIASWSFITAIVAFVRFGRAIKPYRQAARSGNEEAIRKLLNLRKHKPRLVRFFTCQACILLSTAPIIAMTMTKDDQGGLFLVRQHGKLRPATRSEDIEQVLLALQKRGIFTPIGD